MVRIEDIARDVGSVAGDYPIKAVELFGSCARGTASESSDIDLVLHTDDAFSLFDAVDFRERLEALTSRKVDVLSGNSTLGCTFARAIDRDRVLVYER